MRKEQPNSWFTTTNLPTNDLATFATNIKAWFESKGNNHQSPAWFLAHTENGVIWGHMENGKLVLSSEQEWARDANIPEIFPTLAPHTFWEARLFWKEGQIHIWRTDEGFAGCRMDEGIKLTDQECFAFDEYHHLWGTEQVDMQGNFTLIRDGQQNLCQTVPLAVPKSSFRTDQDLRYRPVRLQTRSYVEFDENGQTQIVANRLVSVEIA